MTTQIDKIREAEELLARCLHAEDQACAGSFWSQAGEEYFQFCVRNSRAALAKLKALRTSSADIRDEN